VAAHPAAEFLATYSPDGRSILFNSTRNGRSNVYIVPRNDSAAQRLTTFEGYDAHADWSPDQRSVVFHRSVAKADYDIITHELTGGIERALTSGKGEQANLAWSPDGKYIVFASGSGNDSGKLDLYITDRERTVTVRLTRAPGYNAYPAWSSDGGSLYFNSERVGKRDVYRLDFRSPMVCPK
jgi:TolB protein